MNRKEIEEMYEIKNGTIVSPGQYETEPIYTPYFVDLAMEGFWEQKNDGSFTFKIEPEDRKEFPEIPKGKRWFCLFQDSSGFWYIK